MERYEPPLPAGVTALEAPVRSVTLLEDRCVIRAFPRLQGADLSLEVWGADRKKDVLQFLDWVEQAQTAIIKPAFYTIHGGGMVSGDVRSSVLDVQTSWGRPLGAAVVSVVK